DLPAMDDDDLRRGMPTNHKVYGEGFAILTGDALLTYAFELIAQTAEKEDKSLVLRSLVEIARAAGTEGMIGGQTLDLFFEGKKIDSQTIKDIHRRKTGALITVSARTGAILGRASEKELALVTGYARALGLAFQIVDDLLDLTGDEQKLGKRVGTDRERGKATFPAIYSEEECRKMVVDLYTEALEYLVPFKQRGEMLKKLADKLVFRES
ncbi:MAG: polyprenyl synthetase family protein, partial [Dethiobacteria bacterium]